MSDDKVISPLEALRAAQEQKERMMSGQKRSSSQLPQTPNIPRKPVRFSLDSQVAPDIPTKPLLKNDDPNNIPD